MDMASVLDLIHSPVKLPLLCSYKSTALLRSFDLYQIVCSPSSVVTNQILMQTFDVGFQIYIPKSIFAVIENGGLSAITLANASDRFLVTPWPSHGSPGSPVAR